MSDHAPEETIIPFPSGGEIDPLDRAGQTVVSLLQRAGSIAEENSQHALNIALKLSLQLRSAEDRIKELEANTWHYKERADRAEKWLAQIAAEIEQRFFASFDARSRQASVAAPNPTRQSSPLDYAAKRRAGN